jgi:UDP-glucose 4-epimerase
MRSGTDLVTGGAGFIGNELVRQLASAGRHVIVLDDLSTGRRDNLKGCAAELVVSSMMDRGIVADCIRRAERVFHLACLGLRRSLFDPLGVHHVNATGTLVVLEEARKAEIARFVHVSSSEVYGTARYAPIDEMHTTLPTTPYGASKLAGEAYARAAYLLFGLPVVVLRPFNAFGPRAHHEGDSGEVIPKFLLRAALGRPLIVFGDGCQTRDFTHVSDTARAIQWAAEEDTVIGETLNIGSGVEISVNDLACLMREVAGSSSPTIHEASRPGDVRRLIADSGKARDALGWSPRISLADGLRTLYEDLVRSGQSIEELLASEVIHNWVGAR